MKIVITEQQIRDFLNKNTSNITVDDNNLKDILLSLQKDGFFATSNSKNIFNEINNLPSGDYFIVTSKGKTIQDVENDLETLLNSGSDMTPTQIPTHYFIFKEYPDTIIGKGIMMTQKAIQVLGKHGVEMTPRGSHGGK